MSDIPHTVGDHVSPRRARATSVRTESGPVRFALIATAIVFLLLFLGFPLATVFIQAFGKGVSAYFAAFGEPDARAALRLKLITAAIEVPFNLVFGFAAAWAIDKF